MAEILRARERPFMVGKPYIVAKSSRPIINMPRKPLELTQNHRN